MIKIDIFKLCILLRLLLSIYIYYHYNIYINYFIFIISLSFILLSFGIIKRDKGAEAGGDIWWKENRIIHGILYGFAGLLIHLKYNRYAGIILLFDLIYGLYLRYNYRGYI